MIIGNSQPHFMRKLCITVCNSGDGAIVGCMNRIITTILLLALSTAVTANFYTGLEAYLQGDYKTAFIEFSKSAEQGNADAQYNLGLMYANGKGVPEDDREAVRWYRKAAEQGDAVAQYNLGAMYAKGEGVPEDYVKAYMWTSLAVALGEKRAAKNKEIIKSWMTSDQIAEAQRLSSEWFEKHNR